MTRDAELEAAYRATDYVAELPTGSVVLRVDEPVPEELREALGRLEVEPWAFLTAWNPGSRLLEDHENLRRQGELVEALGEAGFHAWPGEGRGRDGEWPAEASVLVPGMDEDQAVAWGRRYGQKAVVTGRTQGPVRLVWC